MKTSTRGISLLIEFEGFRGNAYIPVPGDVPTIGFGFTKGVKLGDKMTLVQAKERLKTELLEYENAVRMACTHQPNQNQFDALVSFCFNVGATGLRKSSVLKAHNRHDYQAASRAFGLWNKSGGIVYAGLTRRRAAEAALYLEPMELEEVTMPQAVDPERPMTTSSINRASVVAGGTATVAAVSQTLSVVNQVKSEVATLGDWLIPALLVAVVVLCVYVVYERMRQRKDGWA